MTDRAAYLLFALTAAGTPGPSNVILAAVGARAGVRKGLPALLGVTVGMGSMMFLVPLGVGGLVLARPGALQAMRWAGAAVLLWLAWKVASARRMPSLPETAPIGFAGMAAFQWANPKAWLVAVSAAATFLDAGAGGPVAQAAVLGALFMLAALPACALWLAGGAAMRRALRSERRLRAFNVAMGTLLVLSVGLVLR